MHIFTPLERNKLIPFYLRVIRFFISKFRQKYKSINYSLNHIETFSYCIQNFNKEIHLWQIDTEKLILNLKSYSIEKDSVDFSEYQPYFYARGTKNWKGRTFGYDLDMTEFLNIESLLINELGEKYHSIRKIADQICSKLQKNSLNKKDLYIKFVKLYHYNSVEHPRPLHYDSFNDCSYKIFFFLDQVLEKDGPYCIIPGSHNKILNKIMTIYNKSLLNDIWLNNTDGSFYKSSDSIKFKNIKEDELIITKQCAIHGDMPAQRFSKKTAIVFHILNQKNF